MNKKIGKTAIMVIMLTMLTKVLGTFRDLFLSYYYGSTYISDSYILATTLPVTIFAFIYEGISASFIPVYSRLKTKEEENKLTCNMLNLLTIITLVIITFIEIFPESTIKIFASGLTGEALKTAVFFTKISILGVFFSSYIYIFVSYLNYNNSFLAPTIRAIPMDIIVIASIAISFKTNNLLYMAIGIPLSLFVEFAFLIPFIRKKGFKFSLSLSLKDENLKNIILWSIPIIISTAIADINTIIDRQFSSWIMEGGISALTYSNRTINVIRTTFFVPLITILFPMFSKKINSGKKEEVSELTSNSISFLMILAIPLTFGCICLSNDIISILFQRGAFDAAATNITSICLKYYSFSLLGCAISTILTKVFYSMSDMKTPMYISAFGILINIIFNVLFSKKIGLGGLAIATSISNMLIFVIQYYIINKRLKLSNKKIMITLIKSVIASIIMFIILKPLRVSLGHNFSTLISFIISTIVSMIIYFIILLILRTEELKKLILIFKKGGQNESN